MINIFDSKTNFILFSPEKSKNTLEENKVNCERACSILYSKDYTLLSVIGIYQGEKEQSYLCYPNKMDNDKLRNDGLYLMKFFEQESVIIKYHGEDNITKIDENGEEIKMKYSFYSDDDANKTYLFNGISFTLTEQKRYHFPKSKSELKNGMKIEYFNNTEWSEKIIENLNIENEELYELLMKYNKVRIEY